jgi:hypothetical protein
MQGLCTPGEADNRAQNSELLKALTIKRLTSGHTTPCSPVKFKRRFGGTNYQGRRIMKPRLQPEAGNILYKIRTSLLPLQKSLCVTVQFRSFFHSALCSAALI